MSNVCQSDGVRKCQKPETFRLSTMIRHQDTWDETRGIKSLQTSYAECVRKCAPLWLHRWRFFLILPLFSHSRNAVLLVSASKLTCWTGEWQKFPGLFNFLLQQIKIFSNKKDLQKVSNKNSQLKKKNETTVSRLLRFHLFFSRRRLTEVGGFFLLLLPPFFRHQKGWAKGCRCLCRSFQPDSPTESKNLNDGLVAT